MSGNFQPQLPPPLPPASGPQAFYGVGAPAPTVRRRDVGFQVSLWIGVVFFLLGVVRVLIFLLIYMGRLPSVQPVTPMSIFGGMMESMAMVYLGTCLMIFAGQWTFKRMFFTAMAPFWIFMFFLLPLALRQYPGGYSVRRSVRHHWL